MKNASLLAALLALPMAALSSPAAFTMRLDDNKPVKWWRDICDIFERHGFRCSIAVNASRLNEEQGACLRELAARGHEIMDHTPSHNIYSITYPDQPSFERACRLPFVHDADPEQRCVFFYWDVNDADERNTVFRAKVVGGELVPLGAFAGKKPPAKFFKLRGLPDVFSYKEENGRFMLRDFWGRRPKEPVQTEECDVLGYSGWAMQPCDGLLREMASVTRERFDHFGIPRPKIWIFPGGWCGPIRQDAMERVYGRSFGYIGADAQLGPAKRCDGRWYAAYHTMDFFDENSTATPEELVGKIEARIASGKSQITLSHMHTKDIRTFLEKVERFAALLEERGIPVVTMGESIESRFGGDAGAKRPLEVALTFDDGSKEHRSIVMPILAEFGFPGAFNPITGGISRWDTALTWDDLRDLVRAGHEITTHTRTHKLLDKMLAEGNMAEFRHEVLDSAAEIEKETGYRISYVCLPGNHWNPDVEKAIADLGLKTMTYARTNIGGGEDAALSAREKAKAAIKEAIAEGKTRCVLMFHGIDKSGWRPLSHGAADFRSVMELLREGERDGILRVVSYEESCHER